MALRDISPGKGSQAALACDSTMCCTVNIFTDAAKGKAKDGRMHSLVGSLRSSCKSCETFCKTSGPFEPPVVSSPLTWD
jgi:hypothetical protein